MDMGKNKKINIQKITMVAVMAALIFVVTWLVKVPLPGAGGQAYFNLGDMLIYVSAYILGGPLTALAAAIGSGLADFAVGAYLYVVPTIIIKALMGLVAGIIDNKKDVKRYLLACVVAGAIMTAGYTLYEYAIVGALYANISFYMNLIQWAAGVAAAMAFYPAARRIYVYYKSRN